VIVGMVNCAIAGIDFTHAVGRVVVRKDFSASVNTVVTRNGVMRRERCREWDISALTEAS